MSVVFGDVVLAVVLARASGEFVLRDSDWTAGSKRHERRRERVCGEEKERTSTHADTLEKGAHGGETERGGGGKGRGRRGQAGSGQG